MTALGADTLLFFPTAIAWSRKLLEHHIATRRYEREGKALTNFSRTLEPLEGELVAQIVHEDYNFEFLGLAGHIQEDRLERSLVSEIERFMIELGAGFAFVGRQVPLDVAQPPPKLTTRRDRHPRHPYRGGNGEP